MSLSTLIHSVRERPESERERIALGVAFAVTAVLFVAWLLDFQLSPDASQAQGDVGPAPIAVLRENVKALVTQATAWFK